MPCTFVPNGCNSPRFNHSNGHTTPQFQGNGSPREQEDHAPIREGGRAGRTAGGWSEDGSAPPPHPCERGRERGGYRGRDPRTHPNDIVVRTIQGVVDVARREMRGIRGDLEENRGSVRGTKPQPSPRNQRWIGTDRSSGATVERAPFIPQNQRHRVRTWEPSPWPNPGGKRRPIPRQHVARRGRPTVEIDQSELRCGAKKTQLVAQTRSIDVARPLSTHRSPGPRSKPKISRSIQETNHETHPLLRGSTRQNRARS